MESKNWRKPGVERKENKPKKIYTSPKLTVHGTMEEITKAQPQTPRTEAHPVFPGSN